MPERNPAATAAARRKTYYHGTPTTSWAKWKIRKKRRSSLVSKALR